MHNGRELVSSDFKTNQYYNIDADRSFLALFSGVVLFDYLPLDYSSFIKQLRTINLPWFVVDPVKFLVAFFITFHSLNGIRFLVTNEYKLVYSFYNSQTALLVFRCLNLPSGPTYRQCIERDGLYLERR